MWIQASRVVEVRPTPEKATGAVRAVLLRRYLVTVDEAGLARCAGSDEPSSSVCSSSTSINVPSTEGVTHVVSDHLPEPFQWLREAPFFQAGLAGYSDAAMRIVARRHGCPYCVTESIQDDVLVHGGKGLEAARLDPEDHPIAGQLMGTFPDSIAAGARILVELGYDVIDVNLACPTKRVRARCRGGLLLSAPDEAIEILTAVRDSVAGRRPLTVKLRRGYDDSTESAQNFYRIVEAAIDLGYFAATVHGRTVTQKYVGPSSWNFLASLTRRYPSFRFFGSGDVFDAAAIFNMLETTNVRAVAVARGAIANPWIFRQAHAVLHGGTAAPPTRAEQRGVLEQHFQLASRFTPERAVRMMRKFGIKFSRHHPNAADVARAFIAVKSSADWWGALEAHYPQGRVIDAAVTSGVDGRASVDRRNATC